LYIARGFAVMASLPVPEGLLLDAATWNQTPLVVQQLLMQLVTVTWQQEARITALEARLAALEARGSKTRAMPIVLPPPIPPGCNRKPQGGRRGLQGLGPGIQGIARPCWSRPR
jgi:hypothetical protein